MAVSTPKIDARTYEDVVGQTERLVSEATGWAIQPEGAPDLTSALARIFGRLVHQVIERLNQVPDRNFLAFMNLLGFSPEPPQPARVPLTFRLAKGSQSDALVPVHTQAAAQADETYATEAVFETDKELVVTRTRLTSVLVREPAADRYSDRTEQATAGAVADYLAFTGETPLDHSLYLGCDDLLSLPAGTVIDVTVDLTAADAAAWDGLSVECSYPVAGGWQSLESHGLTITPAAQGKLIAFTVPGDIVSTLVGDRSARFLRLRSTVPLTASVALPVVQGIATSALIMSNGIAPEVALASGVLLDTSLDFYPFGERPRFNDTLYLSSAEVFSKPGADVTLTVTPSDVLVPPDGVGASDSLKLVWEAWSGTAWVELGRSTRDLDRLPSSPAGFADGTFAFTRGGDVTFKLPPTVGPTTFQGIQGHFIRARIAQGDYGLGFSFEVDDTTSPPSLVKVGSAIKPPILQKVAVAYTYDPPSRPPEIVLTSNDFVIADLTPGPPPAVLLPFSPFTPSLDTRPALYLGFDQPDGGLPFSNRAATLFIEASALEPGDFSAGSPSDPPPAQVTWEYSSPSGWRRLGAVDETRTLTESGLVRFIGPSDFTARTDFGARLYWVRARWERDEFTVPPRLHRVLLNTVWATHALTLFDEVLGSSNESPGQVFVPSQTPLLAGQRIEVREGETLSTTEQAEIERLEGDDAMTPVADEQGHVEGYWIRWHQVPDFYGSGPRDRHYTIDHATGEVTFGDGRRGLVPPRGVNNVRAALYRTGGGARGNRPRGAVSLLKSTVPYVEGVENLMAASGGADRETTERVKERGPKILRHADRAITVRDFEDLAQEASPGVARAKTIAPYFDPIEAAANNGLPVPDDVGHVTLILVPRSTVARPTPDFGLIRDVEAYIRARSVPAVHPRLRGPSWVRVTVDAAITPVSFDGVDALRTTVSALLEQFLHPLTGGPSGEGWEFGRMPQRSDLYALLSRNAGIDFIDSLNVAYHLRPDGLPPGDDLDPSWPQFEAGLATPAVLDRILIFSGKHQITISALDP